jgi:hypothetical protein
LQKEREIKEGRQAIKQELDEERKRMRQDIMRKKQMQQKTNDIKFELVGVPDFMKEESQQQPVEEKLKPWERPNVKQVNKQEEQDVEIIQNDGFVVMAPNPHRKQWGQRNNKKAAEEASKPGKEIQVEVFVSEKD